MGQLRKSSYIISTRLHDGKTMWIHGYTGAIDILSARLADYLDAHDAFAPEDFPLGEEVFARLAKRGYLTANTKEEEQAHVAHVAGLLHEAHKRMYKNFDFVVTYNCNFRCPYCFENGISGNGQAWSGQVFTRELVDRAYATMREIEPRRELHTNGILLYGGEPLLKENKDIVSYIVEKGAAEGYMFYAVTNGYDLAHYADLLAHERIARLQITLDGYRDTHNARRRHYEGMDTFDRIMENIGLALSKDVKVSVRINTDANNFDNVERLRELFQSLGYKDQPNFSFYSAVLQEYDTNLDNQSFSYQSIKEHVQRHYKEDKEETNCQDHELSQKILDCLKNGTSLNITSAACPSQYASYLFDPHGAIYTCWETIGKPAYAIGQYACNPLMWTQARAQWFDRHVGNAPNCSRCKYALLCGGGCLAKANFSIEQGFGTSACRDYAIILNMAVQKAYKAFSA